MKIPGADIETFPITHLNPSPTPVCLTTWSRGHGKLVAASSSDFSSQFLALLKTDHVWHGGWYDLACMALARPEFFPAVFEALAEGRVHDTSIREMLDNLAILGQTALGKGVPALFELARDRVGMNIERLKGGDGWRLLYGNLWGLDGSDFPEGARAYAILDAELASRIHAEQPDSPAEWVHVGGAFCYYLKTAVGLRVDKAAKERLQAQVNVELDPENLKKIFRQDHFEDCLGGKKCKCPPPLVSRAIPPTPYARGVKAHVKECSRRPDCSCPPKMKAAQKEKVNKTAALIPMIEAVYRETGLEERRTNPADLAEKMRKKFPKGQIKTDATTLKMLGTYSPALKQMAKREEWIKLRTSYFPGLEWPFDSGNTAPRIFPGYEPLKKTGRGSSRGVTRRSFETALYPSVNIQQADPRLREIYLPPFEGWIFAVADYSAIDLACAAQTIFGLFGKSLLRDQINAGINPHDYLSIVVGVHEDPDFRKYFKGLSEEKALEQFKEFRADKTKIDIVEWIRDLCKKLGLGFLGGMGAKTMQNTCAKEGIAVTIADCKRHQITWKRAYPCSARYLRWVPTQADPSGEWLQYTSALGMHRARCSYTECANGKALQTPAAEGKKIADFMVTRACYDKTRGSILYGARPLIDMHDEFVVGLPPALPDVWHGQAMELSKLMVDGMGAILTDVKAKAEPLLTTHWVKKAKQVRDSLGRIRPWVLHVDGEAT